MPKVSSDRYSYEANVGVYEPIVLAALERIDKEKIIERIWQHDFTVWKDDPTEITNRLGWLHSSIAFKENIARMTQFVEQLRSEGFTQALLLGMGGSSLAAEVFRFTFGVKQGYLDLHILDSTHPDAILEKETFLDLKKTIFIVSTKSGGTVETISFFKYFYNKVKDLVGKVKVGNHFIAITDPDSGLEDIAGELNFREVFLNDPNIGGRYSALSYFGLVPAALIGVDLDRLLSGANTKINNCAAKHKRNTCAMLGATLGAMAIAGHDKLTLIISPQLSYFGSWVEQLIAESTGKEGKGIVPVDGEVVASPDLYSGDRLFVYLHFKGDHSHEAKVTDLIAAGLPVVKLSLNNLYDLGGEFFRWEMATALSASLLAINPFDQPDVEAAKVRAKEMMDVYRKKGRLPTLKPIMDQEQIKVFADFDAHNLKEALHLLLIRANPGKRKGSSRSYISLQAYLNHTPEIDVILQSIRTKIQRNYKLATTFGYGPRFLHSTGQLHKGDGGQGLFIQFTADTTEDIAIPDHADQDASSITFGTLINAQALGDRQALLDAGRNVIRIDFGEEIIAGLEQIITSL